MLVCRPHSSEICAYLGGAKSAGADNDHLARLHDRLLNLSAVSAVARRDVCDADGLVVRVEEDARHARIAAEVEVALDVHHAVDVSWFGVLVRVLHDTSTLPTSRGITATASMAIDILGPDLSTVAGLQVYTRNVRRQTRGSLCGSTHPECHLRIATLDTRIPLRSMCGTYRCRGHQWRVRHAGSPERQGGSVRHC